MTLSHASRIRLLWATVPVLALVLGTPSAQEATPTAAPLSAEAVATLSGTPVAPAAQEIPAALEAARTASMPSFDTSGSLEGMFKPTAGPLLSEAPAAAPAPAPAPAPGPCAPLAPGTDVPGIVRSVFQCRLTQAGLAPADVTAATAEALVVSKCESNWDASAVVFNGKYLDRAHPRTGYRYSAAGVFQFIRKTADAYIEGGYANVKDPVKNTEAAAELYLSNRSRGIDPWADWACAAVNDGFASHSVLPGRPGGPSELPAWALEMAA